MAVMAIGVFSCARFRGAYFSWEESWPSGPDALPSLFERGLGVVADFGLAGKSGNL